MDILAIPREILLDIFRTLREEVGTSALLPCLTVCQSWNAHVLTILWSHVVITDSNLSEFLLHFEHLEGRTKENKPDRSRHTQSLTIRLTPHVTSLLAAPISPIPYGTNPTANRLRRDLNRLAALLKFSLFRSIHTFSLCICQPPHYGPPLDPLGFFISRRTIRAFLEALPPSCKNLELDTNGWEMGRDDLLDFDENHLCPVIRTLVPRLNHLRLRLGSICNEIICHAKGGEHEGADGPPDDHSQISISAPRLRSLCISLHAPGDRNATLGFACPAARIYCTGPSHPLYYQTLKEKRNTPKELARSLRHALTAHNGSDPIHPSPAFPRLTQAEITHFQTNNYQGPTGERFEYPPDAWELTHPFYLTLIVIHDLVQNCTFPLPIKEISLVPARKFVAYDRHDICRIGTWPAVFACVEGVPWGASVTGTRMPFDAGHDDVVLRGMEDSLAGQKGFMEESMYGPVGGDWYVDWDAPLGKRVRRVVRIEGVEMGLIEKEWLPMLRDEFVEAKKHDAASCVF